MSSFEYCPRGGQEGIATTENEQIDLAMFLAKEHGDDYIPLPNFQMEQQLINTEKPHDHDEVVVYWENDFGRHGWCCSYCGKVVQWG